MKTIKIKHWTEVPDNFTGIVIDTNGDKFWYLNGKRHRVDGPAIIHANGDKFYFINGERVAKKAQEVLYGFYKLKGML